MTSKAKYVKISLTFMGKIFLLISYFILTPLVLISSIIYLSFLEFQKNSNSAHAFFAPQESIAYAAVPKEPASFIEELDGKDGRVEKVRQFFALYKSPLEPFAQDIITAADNYGLDYRLLPAIAMQESNLCKKAPTGSNNCWGFGIYAKKVRRFASYPEAIDIVTKTLAKDYKNKGLSTPSEIVTIYTPSDNGKWVTSVNYFMDRLSITP